MAGSAPAPRVLPHRGDRKRAVEGQRAPARADRRGRRHTIFALVTGVHTCALPILAYVLFARDAVRLRHLESLIEGFDALRALVADFSPQQVAPYCGIEAAVIEGLADELIRTERSAIYGRIGTCTQSFGTLASWMIDVLAILTGNLDREGGSMWSRPVAPLVDMLA